MLAQNLKVQPGDQDAPPRPSAVPATYSDSSIACLMEALREASTAFLVRFPGPEPPGLRPVEVTRAALEEVLLEPCDIRILEFDSLTLAAVVTPKSEQPMDPLSTHSTLEMFGNALKPLLGGTAGAFPTVLPIARVASVAALQENLTALNELLETIIHKQLRVQFQPIVHFASGRVYGYEALIRMPQTGILKRPGAFFKAADKARIVSWLDVACQEKCFEEAAGAGVSDYLFTNMDAEGLSRMHDEERSLADRARAYKISPSRIVLEITERQAVEDFPRLVQYIEEMREQGFKIAIDDAGAGYNSLHTIAELRPDFVKIDRSLVRSIENNGTRRALLSTIVNYATHIGAAVIAEGLETRDELATVIEVGAPYGQGYLLGKPNDGFKGLRSEMREFIAERLAHRARRSGGLSYPIEKIARKGTSMPPDTLTEMVATKFTKNPDLESIIILDGERIEGLVMRDRLEQTVAHTPSTLQQPVSVAMDHRPLVVEADRPVEEIAAQSAFRREMRFHDDILVAGGGRYVGVVPVRALFEAVTSLSSSRAKYNNPLTDLPGPVLLEQACNERLRSKKPTVVLHADIDHFRAFNRLHGLQKGDEALCALARILQDQCGSGFVGHIGGDDFLLTLDPSAAKQVCENAIREFVECLPELHTAAEMRQGFAEGKDAQGNSRRIPLMSLRLTGLDAAKNELGSYAQAINAIRTARRGAQPGEGSSYTLA